MQLKILRKCRYSGLFAIIVALFLWANPGYANEEISVDLPGGTTMEFVRIEAGTFAMGAPASYSDLLGLPNEHPQHEVTLSRGFYLGKYEVTQAQWEAVMGNNPSFYTGPNHPVEKVSWEDAQVFIHTLNAAAGDSLYRLPTEAEWEYAARAGTQTLWSFGDDVSQFEDYGWWEGNTNRESTKDVGMQLANPWGLYDIHGNVWEWVQDWYGADYYASSSSTDPPGPASGTSRVLRGGSFANSDRLFTRSAFRSEHKTPLTRNVSAGLRLLRMETSETAVTPQSWGQVKDGAR